MLFIPVLCYGKSFAIFHHARGPAAIITNEQMWLVRCFDIDGASISLIAFDLCAHL